MFKAYFNLDQKITSVTQDAYLWLYDRTGIYVATIMFTIYVTAAAIHLVLVGSNHLGMWLVALAMVGVCVGRTYLLQDRGDYKRFNSASQMMEEWRGRHMLNGLFFSFIIGSIIIRDGYEAIVQLLFFVYGYFFLIRIRDRDKKPFFKSAESKPELATESI